MTAFAFIFCYSFKAFNVSYIKSSLQSNGNESQITLACRTSSSVNVDANFINCVFPLRGTQVWYSKSSVKVQVPTAQGFIQNRFSLSGFQSSGLKSCF